MAGVLAVACVKSYSHDTYMQEMIGIAGLVNEFLLQSVKNKIRLFPCWPKDKNAKLYGLHAQGRFIVSATFESGQASEATIKSTVDKQLQLLSPWQAIEVNGKKVNVGEDGIVSNHAKSGQVCHFKASKKRKV